VEKVEGKNITEIEGGGREFVEYSPKYFDSPRVKCPQNCLGRRDPSFCWTGGAGERGKEVKFGQN
jgi:hypothetical protein